MCGDFDWTAIAVNGNSIEFPQRFSSSLLLACQVQILLTDRHARFGVAVFKT